MTAVNAYAAGSAGYLSADAAIWRADGTVREFSRKVIAIPRANTAVAARGIFSQGLFALTMAGARDADDAVTRAERFAATNEARVQREREWRGFPGSISVTGVSWISGEPVQWVVDPDHLTAPGRATGLCYAPDVDLGAVFQGRVVTSDQFGALDPRHAFADLMEAQRAMSFETTAGGLHCVGGWCDLATVTADGVSIETIRKWPDRLNERITP